MSTRWIVPALLSATAALAPTYAVTKSGFLRLVDDSGQEITGELEICFQIGTRSDCVSWRGAPIEVPHEFVAVRVEGPDHGPVSVPQNFKKEPNGDLLLAIPRKVL